MPDPDSTRWTLIRSAAYALAGPCWLPNATHFVDTKQSRYVFKNALSPLIVDIHRAAADGSGKANLTEDIDVNAGLAGWR